MNNYSKQTAKSRRICLQKFIAYMNERNINDPKMVTTKNMDQYLIYLKFEYRYGGKPLSNGAFGYYITLIFDFFKWLEDTDKILVSPIVDRPKVSKSNRIPPVLTEEEVLSILESVSINTPTGLRNRAILELLYSTGIRKGELVNLNVEDFIIERSELIVHKGKTVRAGLRRLGRLLRD